MSGGKCMGHLGVGPMGSWKMAVKEATVHLQPPATCLLSISFHIIENGLGDRAFFGKKK